MTQYLPGLLFLSILAFLGASFAVLPGQDWIVLPIYFLLLIPLGTVLYLGGVKSIDPKFPGALFIIAFLLKLLGGVARYWIVADVYNFAADAPLYHEQGQYVAQFLRQLDLSVFEWYQFRGEGTTGLIHITAVFYIFLPPSLSAMFLWFAGLAFIGSVLFYRAFCLTFPDQSPDFYRVVVFFLPSILFWPSSLGKEAWIFFNAGIATYGLALYFRRGQIPGLVLTGLALLLIFPVRPHVAMFIVLAMIIAIPLSMFKIGSQQSPLVWILGVGGIIALAVFVLPRAQDYIGVNELSLEDIQSSYQYYQGNTSQGGSSYQTYSVLTPFGLVMGLMTVLFRPFPWEADNSQMMVTALESFAWLWLAWRRRHIFLARCRSLLGDPWVAFLAFCSLFMILAFTTFGNFGILARQRVLFLPFLWMLFA
jgi:hypothetical protein